MFKKPKHRNISVWYRLKLNYWGVTKNASSTLKHHLMEQSGEKPRLNQKTLHNQCQYIDEHEAMSNGFRNFAITRHPYKRAASMFVFMFYHYPEKAKLLGFECMPTFDEFLRYLETTSDKKLDIHFQLQTNFITEKIETFDVECLDSWTLDIPPPEVKRNVSNQEIILSRKDKDRIYARYKPDFETFGYEK